MAGRGGERSQGRLEGREEGPGCGGRLTAGGGKGRADEPWPLDLSCEENVGLLDLWRQPRGVSTQV